MSDKIIDDNFKALEKEIAELKAENEHLQQLCAEKGLEYIAKRYQDLADKEHALRKALEYAEKKLRSHHSSRGGILTICENIKQALRKAVNDE